MLPDTPNTLGPIRTGPLTSADVPVFAVSSYMMMANKDKALDILTTYAWKRQRPIDRHHQYYLRDVMLRGEITAIEITFGQLPDGTFYLVDGYHRLNALAMTDLTLPLMVKTYRVKDEDGLARLYISLDRPKVRTVQSMLLASGLSDASPLNPTNLNKVGSAASLIEEGFASSFKAEKSLLLRVQRTKDWLPEGEAFFRLLVGATNEVHQLLTRQPVLAVALATLRHQPQKAYEFWRSTALEEALTRGDPRARLLAWLRANKRIGTLGPARYARYPATAWNAFFEGRELAYIRPSDGPFILRGTPFNGKDR